MSLITGLFKTLKLFSYRKEFINFIKGRFLGGLRAVAE